MIHYKNILYLMCYLAWIVYSFFGTNYLFHQLFHPFFW